MENLIKAYEDYILLLGEELNEVVSIAYMKGWKSKRVEQGKILREKIENEKNTFKERSKITTKEKLYEKNFC
jgi:hypothetical protein